MTITCYDITIDIQKFAYFTMNIQKTMVATQSHEFIQTGFLL